MAATLESLEVGLRLAFKMLNGLITDLQKSHYRTRRDLIALAGLLNAKGITIDSEEWEAAGHRGTPPRAY